MKYDYKDPELYGSYEWNKPRFLINKDDERYEDYQKFKKEYGFYPDETWNLYMSIAIFIIPRLKYFRNNLYGHPADLETTKEWEDVLDKMIYAFESSLNEDEDSIDYDKMNEGFQLFAKYFMSLWS